METIIITSIYNEIIEYYKNKTFDELEEDDENYKKEHNTDVDIDYDNDEKMSFFHLFRII